MKPLKVEFGAFGPYAGNESVDFEKLGSKGLFLICGKTGIGKTMVLDAMTFALYGKSSGHGRDEFAEMRCTRADFAAPTYVRFEFENQGIVYRFERRLDRKQKNLSKSCSLMRKEEDGVFRTMLENPKDTALNAAAEEIIGLSYEQFCQVIILPQGKFEQLLTSKSEDKEKILTSIFGAEQWRRFAEIFYSEASKRLNELSDVRDRIRRSLNDEKCETLADLDRIIFEKNESIDTLTKDFESRDYAKFINEQQELLTVAKRFEDLHRAEKKAAELESEKKNQDGRIKRSQDASRAENVRTLLEASRNAKQSLAGREKDVKAAEKAAADAKIKADDANKKLENHIAKEDETEAKKSQTTVYEGLREEYTGLDEARNDLKNKTDAVKEAAEAEAAAKKTDDNLKKAAKQLEEDYRSLQQKHAECLKAYMSGITGELAANLRDGEPCPVCGSTEHPHKAPVNPNSVSKNDVDDAKEAADGKYAELQKKLEEQEKAKQALDKKHAATEEAERARLKAENILDGKKKKLVSGITSLRDLDTEIGKLKDSVKAYVETREILTKAKDTASEALTKADAALASAKKECETAGKLSAEADEALTKGLSDNGFRSEEEAENLMLPSQERERIGKEIAQYEADVRAAAQSIKDIKTELDGKEEPDANQCRTLIDAASTAITDYETQKAIFKNEAERLSTKAESLKAEGEGIEDSIREAEEDYAFARNLRGDTGTGLQRYVLGIMFSTVIAAANKMLEKVHGGRYRLFRSDDKIKGSYKRGLDLKVYDRESAEHEGRFVNTLSGGEKFLVSLALSIGMSTIAQKSGIRIEALFIDEGFGSLDEDSIDDAMDILNSIQKANGIVGIISHVKILQEQIPSKLSVSATEKGSHITSSIG
ncbi:MAG: SMC family ATPase [Lachnospiraceae bacterium]|nr:SMC family ATPase [Lachnospiraceae bacterium]